MRISDLLGNGDAGEDPPPDRKYDAPTDPQDSARSAWSQWNAAADDASGPVVGDEVAATPETTPEATLEVVARPEVETEGAAAPRSRFSEFRSFNRPAADSAVVNPRLPIKAEPIGADVSGVAATSSPSSRELRVPVDDFLPERAGRRSRRQP
jgi:hypothetical protein